MKKIIYIVLFSILPMLTYAQLDVVNNNVGIGGITDPQERLEVDGIAKTEGNTVLTTGASATTLYERTDGAAVLVGAGNSGAGFAVDEGYNFDIRMRSRAAIQSRLLTYGTILIRGRGDTKRVGIGVANPTEKLHVAGNIAHQGGVIISDRRLKRNATDFNYGLKEVMKLRPLTYDYTGKGGTTSGKYNVGLFAQDLQQIAPEFVSTFTHTEEDEEGKTVSEEEYLKIYDTGIKYMLINAIKEQQAIIETLEERIGQLEAASGNNIESPRTSQTVELGEAGQLLQNQPNPFNETTTIKYNLPQDSKNATMQIMNMNGQVLKTVQLSDVRNGELVIKAGELGTGTYTYTLVVDGQIVDTKKMVLTK